MLRRCSSRFGVCRRADPLNRHLPRPEGKHGQARAVSPAYSVRSWICIGLEGVGRMPRSEGLLHISA